MLSNEIYAAIIRKAFFIEFWFEWNNPKDLTVPLTKIKACVCYFLSNFYFSPNDGPSKTMKNVFDFI